jgi:hypothetical protein
MLGVKSMCLISLNSDFSMKEDVNEGDLIGTPKKLKPLEGVLNKTCAVKKLRTPNEDQITHL